MPSRLLILILAGAVMSSASAAGAQTVSSAPRSAAPVGASAALTAAAFSKPSGQSFVDRSGAARSSTISYAGAPTLRHDGVAKTALDHRFDADGVVGSVGYLCGMDHLAPDTNLSGGGPTSGFGRQGTFLGASLGYSFR